MFKIRSMYMDKWILIVAAVVLVIVGCIPKGKKENNLKAEVGA